MSRHELLTEYTVHTEQGLNLLLSKLADEGHPFVLKKDGPHQDFCSQPFLSPTFIGVWSDGSVSLSHITYTGAGVNPATFIDFEASQKLGRLGDAIANTPIKPLTILQEAQNLIYGDRNDSYGTVTENFGRIAAGWSEIIGKEITPEQVGLMMTWLKIARQVHKPNRDNLVDACGYIGCIAKMEEEEKS